MSKKKKKNKEYTYYAIVLSEKVASDSFDNELNRIFNEFWLRRVLNVIIVYWTDKLNCLSYTPFGEHFLISLNVNETNPERIFCDKTINLNGYQLKVGWFEDERAKISFNNEKPIMKGIDGGFGGMVIKRQSN